MIEHIFNYSNIFPGIQKLSNDKLQTKTLPFIVHCHNASIKINYII